ncbi:hypothetical protein ACFO3D_01395 [Virgibacillus kekensis]|uniref:Uncharacterized protein n=1 Tax=Virgibacillus kekensis TaxID=202261 RepID=A0ABV9DDI8_9BACI
MESIEPIGITIIGGIKINSVENTSVTSVGENSFQAMNSLSKSNIITGQINGDFCFNNLQPFAPVIIDADGFDSTSPAITPTGIGIED